MTVVGGNREVAPLVGPRHQGLSMVLEKAAWTPPGQWLRVAGGWGVESLAEYRIPTPAHLNTAAPNAPVVVTHLYQAAILNRAALRAAGITRDCPDPVGGQIVRGHDGEPTGGSSPCRTHCCSTRPWPRPPSWTPNIKRAPPSSSSWS
ncbi:amidohydrolase family protein [Streptomyces kaempferi]